MKTILSLLFTCAVLAGCQTVPRYYASPLITQENLLVQCPEELPQLADGSGKTILVTMQQWGTQYQSCKDVHNALVQAIRQKQNQK
jgi:hypothetical protein